MRSKKTGPTALAFSVCIFAAALAQSASAAPPADACSLLTQAQVSAVLGVSVDAGSHNPPKYLRMCTWAQSNAPVGGKYVTIMLKTANDFENAKKLMAAPSSAVIPVNGIGDDAYYAAVGTTMVVLYAKKGDVAFNLTVSKTFPLDQQRTIQKTLALEIISKL